MASDHSTYRNSDCFNICQTFCNRSIKTWNLLFESQKSRIDISETTLTELNLLEIQSQHPKEVHVSKFTSTKEGLQTGADWEWWIGGEDRWIGMRIQAKKLDTRNLIYASLGHTNQNGKQVDMLIDDATRRGLIPIYSFYNYWRKNLFETRWNCGTFAKQEQLLGCSIANAFTIRDFVYKGKNDLDTISTVMSPWNCIVCCRGFGSIDGSDSLSGYAAGYLFGSFRRNQERIRLHTEPPYYVTQMIQGESPSEGPRDISYIMVINQVSKD